MKEVEGCINTPLKCLETFSTTSRPVVTWWMSGHRC